MSPRLYLSESSSIPTPSRFVLINCTYGREKLVCINQEHYLYFHVGEEDEDVNSQATVCAPRPPGGPEEPDQETSGQAA